MRKLVSGMVLTLLLLGAVAGPGVASAHLVTEITANFPAPGGDHSSDPATPGVIVVPCTAENGATTSIAAINASNNPFIGLFGNDAEHCGDNHPVS